MENMTGRCKQIKRLALQGALAVYFPVADEAPRALVAETCRCKSNFLNPTLVLVEDGWTLLCFKTVDFNGQHWVLHLLTVVNCNYIVYSRHKPILGGIKRYPILTSNDGHPLPGGADARSGAEEQSRKGAVQTQGLMLCFF